MVTETLRIVNKTLLIANENIENKQNKILKIAKNFYIY